MATCSLRVNRGADRHEACAPPDAGVKYLINGTSVVPGTPSDASTIEYYHIELDTHEVLYAEGALVESFIAEGSERENFSNFVQYERLYGAERQP
jgi:hypothetical protein